MFLMWIILLALIGLIVHAMSGNNLVNAFKLASDRALSARSQCGQSD